jgi:hypothetical protein
MVHQNEYLRLKIATDFDTAFRLPHAVPRYIAFNPTRSFTRDRANPESGRLFRCYYGGVAPVLSVQLSSTQSRNPPVVHTALGSRKKLAASDQIFLRSSGHLVAGLSSCVQLAHGLCLRDEDQVGDIGNYTAVDHSFVAHPAPREVCWDRCLPRTPYEFLYAATSRSHTGCD